MGGGFNGLKSPSIDIAIVAQLDVDQRLMRIPDLFSLPCPLVLFLTPGSSDPPFVALLL